MFEAIALDVRLMYACRESSAAFLWRLCGAVKPRWASSPSECILCASETQLSWAGDCLHDHAQQQQAYEAWAMSKSSGSWWLGNVAAGLPSGLLQLE